MNIEQELQKIVERNKRVEADKAWEKSKFRVIFILVFTYAIAFVFMVIVGLEKPWLGAFVPVLGYFLSTLSLKPLRKWWIGKIYKV